MRRAVGVALKCANFGNSSQVVHLLTPGQGLVGLLAKGVWRPRNPMFGGGFDVGRTYEFVYIPRSRGGLGLVTEAQEVECPRRIARDRARTADAFLVLAFAAYFAVPEGGDAGLYGIVKEALHALDAGSETALLAFLRAGLDNVGFLPCLDSCVKCGAPPWEAGRYGFSNEGGGLVCPQHPAEADRMVARAVVEAARGAPAPEPSVRGRAVRFFIDWANHVLAFRRRVLEYPFYLVRKQEAVGK
jgi:DNA repair protein RecO